jgi:hypothetical protein
MPPEVKIAPCEKIGGTHLTCIYPDVRTIDEMLYHMSILLGHVNTKKVGGVLNLDTNVLTLRCFVWPEAA